MKWGGGDTAKKGGRDVNEAIRNFMSTGKKGKKNNLPEGTKEVVGENTEEGRRQYYRLP